MKLHVICFMVFMAVIFTNSTEINPVKYKSNKKCKTVELEAEYYNGQSEERSNKSNEESPSQRNNPSQYSAERDKDESLAASTHQPALEILENIPVAANYFYGLKPQQRSFDGNGPWQRIDSLPELRSVPYSGIQYYAHPSLFTAYSPLPSYLPPVVPTYARRSIPELHSQAYRRRPARVIRSRQEDDFMAELQHMAMMNNILPTMPIPFMRSSYGHVPYEASSVGGATAVYPASASGCALPLLFSCSPKITRGNLAKPLPSDYSQSQWSSAKEQFNQIYKELEAEDKSGGSQIIGSLELADDNGNGNDMKAPTMNAIDRALKPKNVGKESHVGSDKKHTNGTAPAVHVTS